MKFYVTVIQVRDLASYKTKLNPPFHTQEKSLYQVMNMTVVIHTFDVFELLILTFDHGLCFEFSLEFNNFVILLYTSIV